jgi:hypothetical protein
VPDSIPVTPYLLDWLRVHCRTVSRALADIGSEWPPPQLAAEQQQVISTLDAYLRLLEDTRRDAVAGLGKAPRPGKASPGSTYSLIRLFYREHPPGTQAGPSGILAWIGDNGLRWDTTAPPERHVAAISQAMAKMAAWGDLVREDTGVYSALALPGQETPA